MEGPLLSDSDFFQKHLNLNYEGMERVKYYVGQSDYSNARIEMAYYVRHYLQPDRFFKVPYEPPENIYKLRGESDDKACQRICNHSLVSVGVPNNFGKDQIVNWKANPTYNNYKEWTWQLNRHNDLKLLAHQYRLTKDQRLSKTAAELLLSWIRQAKCPGDCEGYETECWRTIECGIRMGANWPYVLFTFFNTEAFTNEILIDWYKSVWEHGWRLSKNYTSNNWLIMEMNGLGQIGILYPQFHMAKQWFKQASDTLEKEIERQFYPDGFQYELSTSYHDVVINNYQRFIEIALAYKKPVSDNLLSKLKTAIELDVKLMMPNGLVPDLNDGCTRSVLKTYQVRKRIYKDSRLIQWVIAKDEDKKPNFTTTILPWSGFIVMRTGWENEDSWVLFDVGPLGKAHHHEDKLSILFYANQKLLLTEAGNYAYDNSEMRQYVLSTRAHNTVLVDTKDQNRRKGYDWKEEDILKKADLKFKTEKKWDYGEGEYAQRYGEDITDVIHNRRVFFYKGMSRGVGPFLIVVDRIKGKMVHQYDALWHIDSILESQSVKCFKFCDINIVYSLGTAEVVAGRKEPEWQGFVAVRTSQGSYRSVNCVDISVTGKEIRLVSVLYPRTYGTEQVEKVEASSNVEDEGITITFADKSKWEIKESDLM